MSELSVRQYLHNDGSGLTWGYDKSEADKVIARHKYKRCLAMAEKCDYKATIYRMMINVESSKIDSCPYFIKLYSKKKERFAKWHKRWLALAEKFKETK